MDPFTIVAIVGIILGSLIVLFTIGAAIRLHMIRSKASPSHKVITVDTPLHTALNNMEGDLTTEELMHTKNPVNFSPYNNQMNSFQGNDTGTPQPDIMDAAGSPL